MLYNPILSVDSDAIVFWRPDLGDVDLLKREGRIYLFSMVPYVATLTILLLGIKAPISTVCQKRRFNLGFGSESLRQWQQSTISTRIGLIQQEMYTCYVDDWSFHCIWWGNKKRGAGEEVPPFLKHLQNPQLKRLQAVEISYPAPMKRGVAFSHIYRSAASSLSLSLLPPYHHIHPLPCLKVYLPLSNLLKTTPCPWKTLEPVRLLLLLVSETHLGARSGTLPLLRDEAILTFSLF